ncbi:MAG: hypothetical protein ACREPH_09300 [Rhodanobacteraceae bacterium]
MQQVRRNQMPHRAQRIDGSKQACIRRNRRMTPEAAVAQAHQRHAGRKRHAAAERRRHPHHRATAIQMPGASGFNVLIGS